VEARVAFFLEQEAQAIAAIPPRPALH
jgi:hypothetical protein